MLRCLPVISFSFLIAVVFPPVGVPLLIAAIVLAVRHHRREVALRPIRAAERAELRQLARLESVAKFAR